MYDVIIDLPGNHPWSDLRRALTPEGTYVLIGHDQYGGASHRWFGSLGRFGKLLVISPFVNQLHPFRGANDPDRLVVLKEFIEAGKVMPVVDRTFQLSEVPEAIRYLESGRARWEGRHQHRRLTKPMPPRVKGRDEEGGRHSDAKGGSLWRS